MKKHLLLLLCSVFLIITSCNDHDDNTESKNLFTSQLIGKGIITANYVVQQNTVMTSSAQWNQFLNQIDTPTHQTSANFTEINIDFNQFMVIVVIDEVYPNGGHSIDIMTVDEHPQYINVDIEKLLQGNATSVVTQPYHIVKIPKTIKPILFN
ncbi:hypothetical protein [Chryseobacterium sp. RLHN22]|uniref:hypothetical protein n=1 Tax=Chryseobacterium sp. RLHN22 TaxID=3437885 RepID=UPI003D9AE303